MARRRTRADASRPLAMGTRADGVGAARGQRRDGPGAGFYNSASGQGSAMDRQKWTTFENGCELDATQINAIMRNMAVARRMARLPSEDSNREGHVVKGSVNGQPLNVQVGGPPVETDAPPDPFSSWVQKFGLHRKIIQADSQALAHGRALWVYGVDDGQASDQPLDLAGIRELVWLRVVSRQYAYPMTWEDNPASPRFELPTHYQVSFLRSGVTAIYHWTRVWDWDGVDLSEEERFSSIGGWRSDGAGGSVFDLAWSGLKNYGVSQELAVEALSRLTQGVWKNDNLARAVDGNNSEAAAKHYERLAFGGGPFGDYALAEGESYGIVGRPVTGMGEVIERFEMALVASSDLTEPILMGVQLSVSGLNSDADGLVRAHYDVLASRQPVRFSPPVRHFYSIASRALNGPTGGIPILDLDVGWPPLWQETPAEKAATRVANSTARASDLASGSISVGESRSDQTLTVEYEMAPEGVSTVQPEPEVQVEEIEIADDGLMPAGEVPISLKQAAEIIGRRSAGSAVNFAAARGVPIFRPNPMGPRVVFASHFTSAMRESMVV